MSSDQHQMASTSALAASARELVVQHASSTSAIILFLFSTVGLGAPTYPVPFIVTLALVLVSQSSSHPAYPIRRFFAVWPALAVGACVTRAHAALSALSSPSGSLLALLGMSALSTFYLMLIVATYETLRNRFSQRHSILLFPALWATSWYFAAQMFSDLVAIGPSDSIVSYRWLNHWAGPMTPSWICAAWSVLIASVIEPHIPAIHVQKARPLIDIEGIEPASTSPEDPTKSVVSSSRPHIRIQPIVLLGLFLTALTVPSFFHDDTSALSVDYSVVTPFQVGCILPQSARYKHHHFSLEDYIEESKKYRSASLLLWPESAVTFVGESERDEAFAMIAQNIPGPYVGVSFVEYVDSHVDPMYRRSGVALISHHSKEPHLIYYKRHLVPVAESFSLRHSTAPPSLYQLDLSPPKDITKPDWAPAPNYTRPVTLSASICFDFAFPGSFTDLNERPSLVLAPAQTWDSTVGRLMWSQAKQRAEEIGSMVLWCDGGTGGVSGIAGMGFDEPMRVGEGSWIRTIGLRYPIQRNRTPYADWGIILPLLLMWTPSLLAMAGPEGLGAIHGVAGKWHRMNLRERLLTLFHLHISRRRQVEAQDTSNPLLIDVNDERPTARDLLDNE